MELRHQDSDSETPTPTPTPTPAPTPGPSCPVIHYTPMVQSPVGLFTVGVFQDIAWATKGIDALKQAGFPPESRTITSTSMAGADAATANSAAATA